MVYYMNCVVAFVDRCCHRWFWVNCSQPAIFNMCIFLLDSVYPFVEYIKFDLYFLLCPSGAVCALHIRMSNIIRLARVYSTTPELIKYSSTILEILGTMVNRNNLWTKKSVFFCGTKGVEWCYIWYRIGISCEMIQSIGIIEKFYLEFSISACRIFVLQYVD